MIRVSRIAAPITALGPGVRVAVWVQGCSLGCAGCASVDTWDAAGGVERVVADVAREVCDEAARTGARGLTISGGEPFQQHVAVADLVDTVRRRWPAGDPVDVLAFTGYAASAARRVSPTLWAALDAAIAGPYVRTRPSTHPLLASANQTLELLTDLGRERIAAEPHDARRVQISVQGRDLHLAGLPNPGDLDRLRAALARDGIRFADVSWEG